MPYDEYDALTDSFCYKDPRYRDSPNRGKLEASSFIAYVRVAHFESILDDYPINPDKYVRKFSLFVNGKKREIITYNGDDGLRLRVLHRMFTYYLRGCYQTSPNSFAYKKGSSVANCIDKHLSSDTFLKTDIHHYFDSIPLETTLEKFFALKQMGQRRRDYFRKVFAVCFYNNRLPIGFVSSPILSDFYLHDLDNMLEQDKSIQYTRYADDIIISSSGPDAEDNLNRILGTLKHEMTKRHLCLNYKKTYIRKLKAEGDAIHLLGLNLVRKKEGNNRITVSDRYIRQTSMELCNLIGEKSKLEEWELRQRFFHVMGKIAYIHAASDSSSLKLQKMLCVKTGHAVDLSYNDLSKFIMNNDRSIQDYEHKRHKEEYDRSNGVRHFPASGRTWEIVTASKTHPWWNPINHLYAICRQYEAGALNRVAINRLDLSIGDESYSFTSNIDPALLRAIVKKGRAEKKQIIYYADYSYDNYNITKSTTDASCSEVFCPLIMRPSGFSGVAYLYDENSGRWLFSKSDENGKMLYDNAAFMNDELSSIFSYTEWKCNFEIELSLPLHINEEIKIRIEQLYSRINSILNSWSPDGAMEFGIIRKKIRIDTDSQHLYNFADLLQEAVMLIMQTKGYADVKGWCIPVGFLETTKKTSLKYLSFSMVSNKLIMQSFTS